MTEVLFLSTLPARGATGIAIGTAEHRVISIHAPREGSDSRTPWRKPGLFLFLSTLPARGATRRQTSIFPKTAYFYPRSPRGERRRDCHADKVRAVNFYPRSPRGERPVADADDPTKPSISIHAPREGSDRRYLRLRLHSDISIHAPREGSDQKQNPIRQSQRISIHAPREGSDEASEKQEQTESKFLSTLPARGATVQQRHQHGERVEFLSTLPARGATRGNPTQAGGQCDFYPRSPRGERQPLSAISTASCKISIHAPREGSDADILENIRVHFDFYPRSPRGERPGTDNTPAPTPDISIHAPREGSDVAGHVRAGAHGHISIHAPREGSDLYPSAAATSLAQFLSTLPARGATWWSWPCKRQTSPDFYPRSPRGERQKIVYDVLLDANISIHAPREGSDLHAGGHIYAEGRISIHAPREGSDRTRCTRFLSLASFLSTLPARGATIGISQRRYYI